jgi:hypothetical protein
VLLHAVLSSLCLLACTSDSLVVVLSSTLFNC